MVMLERERRRHRASLEYVVSHGVAKQSCEFRREILALLETAGARAIAPASCCGRSDLTVPLSTAPHLHCNVKHHRICPLYTIETTGEHQWDDPT